MNIFAAVRAPPFLLHFFDLKKLNGGRTNGKRAKQHRFHRRELQR
jgi:hypothetical protein